MITCVLQKYWLHLKRLSGVTIQLNNLRASSDGQDAGYCGLIGLNEMLDHKTVVTNGHLPVQARAVLHHANMVGGVGGASSGMLGISSPPDPYLLVQTAALQSMHLSRQQMDGSLPGKQVAAKVLAKRRTNTIYNIIPKFWEWLTINCVVNATGNILLRFYISK
jgi:hypothetical protein